MEELKLTLDKNQVAYLEDEPLSRHSTWKIGGSAHLLAEPSSVDQIQILLSALKKTEIPWIVIGGGSNLLFSDEGFYGVVIKLDRRFSSCHIDGDCLTVSAGAWTPSIARLSASHGLSGLEHTIGIPGNIGGLVYMNGGSLRQSVGDLVEWVLCVDENGQIHKVLSDDCDFFYRHSCFQEKKLIVLEACLKLKYGDPASIRESMSEIMNDRKSKFPLAYPNCGSVFSNDPDIYVKYGPPGKVIEDCGLKGLRVGDAVVSEKHANFIVNMGKASALDVITLVRAICRSVRDFTGMNIPCEVQYVKSDGEVKPLHMFCP